MNTESRRGGCLDALVKTVTFGQYGIETTYVPGIVPTDFDDLGNPNNATNRALQTGKTVIVHDFIAEGPHLQRKIVKNK